MSSNLAISLVIGASVGGAVNAIRGLRNEIGILRNSELSTSAKFGELGKGMLKSLSGAVSMTSLVGSSVMGLAQPAIAFESAMADVKKVVDFKTPEGFKNLSKDLLELTRILPMTAEELAAITAAGGQLGGGLKKISKTLPRPLPRCQSLLICPPKRAVMLWQNLPMCTKSPLKKLAN